MTCIRGLSACIITLNEEDNLPDCLQSLDFAEEIVIVDSGSTDGTRKIATQAGARFFTRKFDNYIQQKNHAISLAKGPWILFLDADERISPELREQILGLRDQEGFIRAISAKKREVSGFRMPRLTYYLGRWIRHSGWYPDYSIRLFRKGEGRFVGKTFHEKVEVHGEYATLRGPILHYSYRNIQEHLNIINRYSDLFAEERLAAGKSNGVLFSIGEAVVKFLSMYLWRFGFLDGKTGLVIAVLGSYYNFLKYIKVWEKLRSRKRMEKSRGRPQTKGRQGGHQPGQAAPVAGSFDHERGQAGRAGRSGTEQSSRDLRI